MADLTIDERVKALEITVGKLKNILDRIIEIDVVTSDNIIRSILAIRVDRPEPAAILVTDKLEYRDKGIAIEEPVVKDDMFP